MTTTPVLDRCNCEADPAICDGTHTPSACTRPAGLARADMLGPICDACAATYADGGYLHVDTEGRRIR